MPLSSIFGRKRSNSHGGGRTEGSVSPAPGGSSLSSLQSNSSMTSLASVSRSNSVAAHASRFEENLHGGHTHRLKNTRRQEKLGRMLREMVGERKKVGDDAVSAVELMPQGGHQLSLMSGLVNKINNGQVQVGGIINGSSNGPKKGTPTVEQDQIDNFDIKKKCLAEKYGKCQEVIGKGSYGIVRVAHRLDRDGKEVLYAVKEFRKRSQEDEEQYKERLMSEFCISSALRHHNIVDTLDLMQDAHGSFCEVMEYCPGGDLYSLILSTGTGLLPHEADCFFKQILRGVVYMHSMGVAHCDLKPENILLTQDGICKISDFGNGECFRMAWEKKIHLSNGVCGSGPYIAPEEFKNKPFDPRAVDIWAMGIIYMVMRTGSYLWRTASQDEDENYHQYLVDRKTSKGYAPIEKLGYSKCVYVIYSILDPVPTRRITGKQILNSEWGRGIRVCEAGEASLHEPPLRVDERMTSPGLEGLKSVAKQCTAASSSSKPASAQSSIASNLVSPATSVAPSPASTRPQSPATTRPQSPANARPQSPANSQPQTFVKQ